MDPSNPAKDIGVYIAFPEEPKLQRYAIEKLNEAAAMIREKQNDIYFEEIGWKKTEYNGITIYSNPENYKDINIRGPCHVIRF